MTVAEYCKPKGKNKKNERVKQLADATVVGGLGDISDSSVLTSPKSFSPTKKYIHVKLLSSSRNTADALIMLQDQVMISISVYEFIAVSPYFHAAFNGNFLESKEKIIYLQTVKKQDFLGCCAILRLLLEKKAEPDLKWMSMKTAFDILDVASYLHIDTVSDVIMGVILDKITASTLVSAYHRSENRYIPLAQKLWEIIVSEFGKIVKEKTFLELSESEIIKLLRNKRLNIHRSEEISVVKGWIHYREADKLYVATKLRYELIGRDSSTGFLRPKIRIPCSVLIASGGWCPTGPTTILEAYDPQSEQWLRSQFSLFEQTRAYHSVINNGHYLFTVGGFNGTDYYRTTRRFSLDAMTWDETAPMYDKRCYVSCSMLDRDRILALGGYDGNDRLRSAEIYYAPTNQWSRIANMNLRRSDGHSIIINGIPYAVGGFDGISCHSTLEYYEVENNRWILMKKPMHSRRSGVSAVALFGGIFVCGGFNGVCRLQSCEIIDPREGNWHRLQPMLYSRSNFGIEILNNQVIVAGGYGGAVGTISSVEAYDIRADGWMEISPLGLRRSALFLSQIDNYGAIEKILYSSGLRGEK